MSKGQKQPEPDPIKLTDDEAEPVCGRCVKDSWYFWGIRDDWKIKTHLYREFSPSEAAARCELDLDYLRVNIHVYLGEIEDRTELWEIMAHEMAHVVTAEYDLFHRVVKTNTMTDEVWTMATERTTVLLERVFLRERPYPGDDAFRQKEVT